MPSILDNLVKINKLDSQNMLGSLNLVYKQVEQIWDHSLDFELPKNYKDIRNVCVFGMGGSALGAHMIKTLFTESLKVPVEVVSGYEVPGFVNNKTLIISSSYSGSTEEVLEVTKKTMAKKAKVMVIASGGKLVSIAKRNKLPLMVFSTENNPCGSPRMGLGYSIVGQLVLFSKAGLIKLSQKKVKEIIKVLSYYDGQFGALVPEKENLAKQIAQRTLGKSVWYVGSEHLVGNIHVAANQMNENAKRFAGYYTIPELNHHLMEGMLYPATNKKSLLFVLIESDLYHKRVWQRYKITKTVLKKNNIESVSYVCREKDELLQSMEILVLCSYISYYSAILKGVNPTGNPYVDYFKKQLAK